jgi:aminoglycoside phosphotransferase
LINVADRYIDLELVKDDIKKNPRTPQHNYTYRPLSGLGDSEVLLSEE